MKRCAVGKIAFEPDPVAHGHLFAAQHAEAVPDDLGLLAGFGQQFAGETICAHKVKFSIGIKKSTTETQRSQGRRVESALTAFQTFHV
jgi:hypothetical protein